MLNPNQNATSVQVFNNTQFGEIRVAKDNNGEPLFCLTDLCKSLNLSNTTEVSKKLDEEDKSKLNLGLKGKNPIFITESGMYTVILRSDSPKAKPMQKWVTSEVLPAIRKSGGYVVARADDTPELIMARALQVAQQTIERHTHQLALAESTIREQAPKVEYFDEVLQSNNLIAVNVIAKELGMSAVTLNKKLHDLRVIYKSNGVWVLYEKYQNKGYTKTKTHKYIDSLGREQTQIQTYWTETGRVFIHELMQKGCEV